MAKLRIVSMDAVRFAPAGLQEQHIVVEFFHHGPEFINGVAV
jgi:hypothetical protein